MGDLAARDATAEPPDVVPPGATAPAVTRRRRWWALAVGGLGALLLVAWVVVGTSPRLADGNVALIAPPWVEEDPDPSVLEPPLWGTWSVTDPPGEEAEIMVSFVNAGLVPVTLTGAADGFVVKRVQFVALDLGVGVGGEPRIDEITLAPGDVVGVWQTLGFPCEATYTAGNGIRPVDLPLRARTLGLARDLSLPQPADVTLVTGSDRTTACDR